MKKRIFQLPKNGLAPLDLFQGQSRLENRFITLFGASGSIEDSAMFQQLSQAWPETPIIGCSTSGQIFGPYLVDGESVGLAVEFESTQVRSFEISLQQFSNSFSAGMELGRKLKAPDLKGVYVLSDGLKVNGSQLVSGMTECLGAQVTITGGLAGDGTRFSETWIYSQGQFKSGVVVALGFYGPDVQIRSGVQGGWEIFGPRRRITRSKDNVVFEIDQRPALDLYKLYLGNQAESLPSSGLLYPLLTYSDPNSEIKTVRTILGIDEEKKSLIFAGDMPEGSYAQLMMASKSNLIDGAHQAAQALNAIEEGVCLSVSCVGRRLVLAGRTEEELEAVVQSMPESTPLIGFYSYGEIAPLTKGSPSVLHNQTMTLTYITERSAGVKRAG